MDKKKNITIVIVVLILIATIFLIATKIKKDKITEKNQSEPVNMFGAKSDPTEMNEAMGDVENISEKTMTIKTNKGEVIVNVNGATSVMFTDVTGKEKKLAQMSDVKIKNLVYVQYNVVTKNVNLITIMPSSNTATPLPAVTSKTVTPNKTTVPTKK